MSPAARSGRPTRVSITGALVVAVVTLWLVSPSGAQSRQRDGIHRVRRPVQGRYIVRLRTVADAEAAAEAFRRLGRGRVRHVYRSAYSGFAIDASEAAAGALASDPAVAYVEQDSVISVAGEQSLNDDDSWGLDRIDQRVITPSGPRTYDHLYHYLADGSGVNVYVVDTGIRTTHVEFAGRAFAAFDAVLDDPREGDCNGHGTHVAGTVGGARFGVAKAVALHSVRVIRCEGWGYLSDVMAGIDWIAAHAVRPAVINMSLGGDASDAFNESARGALMAGITFVGAAGNDTRDSCAGLAGGEPGVIVAAAADSSDSRAFFSNYGRCVDLFAPGVDIISASPWTDDSSVMLSGTSMASPHVAGAAALFLQHHPDASPAAAADAITRSATRGVIRDAGTGSPNRLLFTWHFGDTTPPAVSVVQPAPGATVRGTQIVRVSAKDNVEVATVAVSACGSRLGTDSRSPLALEWDTTAAQDGACSVRVEARDLAGNVATARVSVIVQNRHDVQPPQLTLSTRHPLIRPVNGKFVPVIFTGTVADSVSRISAVSFRTTDEYGRVQPAGEASVTDGRFEITLYLEARRHGADRDGRQYVVSVSARDAAGNRALVSASATVLHDSGN